MKVRIIFDGETYKEFESDEIDDSLFSESKLPELSAMFNAIDMNGKKNKTVSLIETQIPA